MTAELWFLRAVIAAFSGVAGIVVLRRVGVTSRPRELALIGAAPAIAGCSPPLLLPAAVPLVLFGVSAAIVDFAEYRVPNRLSATLFASLMAWIACTALFSGTTEMLLRGVVGGVAWAGLLLVSFVLSGHPGPGDVKLAPSLGLLAGAAGWSAIGAAIVFGYLIAGIQTLAIVVLRPQQRRIPLAPAMVGGTVLAIALTMLVD